MLVTGHKRDSGREHSSYIPSCSPCLLVIISEASTNGFVGFEATTGGIKEQFRRRKRVIFVELKYTMVETLFVDAVKSKDTEMETEQAFSCD